MELLNGPIAPNRTLIHELLAGSEIRDSLIEDVAGLIEKVTMGELEWDKFVLIVKEKLT